ncbi:MAG: signal peptidase I [Acidimicrobiia bacterium]
MSEDDAWNDETWSDSTWSADAPSTVQVAEPSPSEYDLVAEPPRTQRPAKRGRGTRWLVEWGVLIAGALAIAVVIKAFLFQPFVIPSGSMIPTLKIHDRVLVNKLSYRLHDVHRGDIVVFRRPPDFHEKDINDLVKRVIGLPGDTVEAPGGKVTINGRALDEPYLAKGTVTDFESPTWDFPNCAKPADGKRGCVVPAGSYLVLGDNRGSSQDGRKFGPIKEKLIIGRVFMRIWPPNRIGFL